MTDATSTVSELMRSVIGLVREKGWGDGEGIQNPQQVAMAMTVEMSELLEHFQWLSSEDVEGMLRGGDRGRVRQIGEEFADVMIYGLQLCHSLKIDVSAEIERKLEIVRNRAPLAPGACEGEGVEGG